MWLFNKKPLLKESAFLDFLPDLLKSDLADVLAMTNVVSVLTVRPVKTGSQLGLSISYERKSTLTPTKGVVVPLPPIEVQSSYVQRQFWLHEIAKMILDQVAEENTKKKGGGSKQ
ncbi:hypothetical protein LCGC14_0409830 [marine sediment metagenome]|uniref:Uncharacterized protein n=1 Tax=marine sediment metagenome TaxID=412755 RepID=A0A0F9SZR6_9ZZZZ